MSTSPTIADAVGRPAVSTSPAGRDLQARETTPVAEDDHLMRLVAEDDAVAFQRLVARWQQPVFAFLARMVGSNEDALDLTQEVFVRIHRERKRYRPAGRFRSWLFRIAGNQARSSLRRRRLLHWVHFDPHRHDSAVVGDSAASQREREQLGERVRAAIAALPERQRQAIVLRRFEQMNYEEIAQTLATTAPAVESLLQRAMVTLKRDLGPWMVG
ncbi:MAG: sigma-70 family RNA polymerase sigma factor [Candidatus Eisenbacteria bacterium]